METQTISFDLPSSRNVDKVVGQYPEFGPWGVKLSNIIITVPEIYMQRNEIKFDLPGVTMKTQEIIIGLPQIRMGQVKWVISLPQFQIKNVSMATDRIKERGEKLKQEGTAIGTSMTAEVNELVGKFKLAMGGGSAAISGASNTFNSALGTIKNAIDTLQAQGVDPIKVPTSNGDINLRKQLDELVTTRDEVIPAIKNLVDHAATEVIEASAKLID